MIKRKSKGGCTETEKKNKYGTGLKKRSDLEDANFVVKKTRSSDDIIGGHGRKLVIFEVRVFYHGGCHRLQVSQNSRERRQS